MKAKDIYQKWLQSPALSKDEKEELTNIEKDNKEIEDRFYQYLSFGTAGIRGKMGIGSNRMNRIIIGMVSAALGKAVQNQGKEAMNQGVAIAYDCRKNSKLFAEITASVLSSMDIKVLIFKELKSTPQLSYAVREFKCTSGVVITASHNPRNYNGYKVYWSKGSQILSEKAKEISKNFEEIREDININIPNYQEEQKRGYIKEISSEFDKQYIESLKLMSLRDKEIDKDLKIVYTPLNGTGLVPVTSILKERGFDNVYTVKEERNPDENFSGITYPNPEDPKVFKRAIELAKEKDADLIMASDPDCDRMAIMVKDNDNYTFFNGNKTAAILIEYILSSMSEKDLIKENSAIVKTIVSSNLPTLIAQKYSVEMIETLTGFKHVCSFPNKWDETKEKHFIMGFEESIGYCVGNKVRDKDAVNAAMFIAEAAAYYKKKGKDFITLLDNIYQEYGFHYDEQVAFKLEGSQGKEEIKKIMKTFRENLEQIIPQKNLYKVIDYLEQKEYIEDKVTDSKGTPPSNVLRFFLKDNTWFALRPSGTEPKIKFYFYSNHKENLNKAKEQLNKLKEEILDKVNKIIS